MIMGTTNRSLQEIMIGPRGMAEIRDMITRIALAASGDDPEFPKQICPDSRNKAYVYGSFFTPVRGEA
jgi:hypothetical protein